MSKSICIVEDCRVECFARDRCRKHYRRDMRAGVIAPLDRSAQHRLTDVDANAATAICAVCGPTAIRVRNDGKAHECMTVRRANQGPGGTNTRWRMRTYGISDANYAALLSQQGGCCAICRQPPGERSLAVDHDHLTGRIRGLLCGLCNTALGLLRDNPDLIDRASAYLRNQPD